MVPPAPPEDRRCAADHTAMMGSAVTPVSLQSIAKAENIETLPRPDPGALQWRPIIYTHTIGDPVTMTRERRAPIFQ